MIKFFAILFISINIYASPIVEVDLKIKQKFNGQEKQRFARLELVNGSTKKLKKYLFDSDLDIILKEKKTHDVTIGVSLGSGHTKLNQEVKVLYNQEATIIQEDEKGNSLIISIKALEAKQLQ